MNKNAKRVVLSGMAVIMMVSCGTAKKGGQSDTGVASKGDMEAIDNDYLILSDAQRDLLAKNNTFAINLFNKTNGMDSRVISPLSVTGLMTILANGADGDTRRQCSSQAPTSAGLRTGICSFPRCSRKRRSK